MLAQTFKTPADLGISDAEFEALVKVLGMLERAEIPANKFCMRVVGKPECGTAGCIMGWARSVSAKPLFHDCYLEMDAAIERCRSAVINEVRQP